jgi:predicted secreted protein with PEFG-CTERM motif
LVVWTEDTIYDHNSSIILEGYLRPQFSFNPVTIIVTNPIGNIVTIEQITPDSDGNFSLTINTAGNLWSSDGNYIIKAQNGPERVFKTDVEIISFDLGTKYECNLTEISVFADNGGVYCVQYHATGETTGVEGIIDTETKTLTLNLRGKGIESITIELPRYLLDSQTNSLTDSDFVVLLNGIPIEYEEGDSTSDYRMLTISYPPDRQGQIEIIGTSVVSEFGAITILILAVIITGTLVFSKKYNLTISYS